MGDVIQAGAALQLYRAANPKVEIDWVVDQALAPLVCSFNVADKVIPIVSSGFLSGSLTSRLLNLWRAMRQIKLSQGAYDAIYCGHPDWRFSLLGRLVRTRRRFSPKTMRRHGGFILDRNRVYEYYRLLSGKDAGSLPIDDALFEIGKNVLAAHPVNGSEQFKLPRRYLVLMPGGAKNALRDDPLRRWAIESYVELTRVLLNQDIPVVLLGGPGDKWVSEHFAGLDILDIVGRTSLTDMVALLDRASCAVTHDSGPMHLASITSVPLVGIFGPTPANAVLSFSRPQTIILQPQNGVACSPCYDGRSYANCSKNLCMQATTIDQVLLSINELVAS